VLEPAELDPLVRSLKRTRKKDWMEISQTVHEKLRKMIVNNATAFDELGAKHAIGRRSTTRPVCRHFAADQHQ